jgi:putative acyl-CoA dehydrogenase
VQCLDVLRAIQKSPEVLEAYFAEVGAVRGESPALDGHVETLKVDLKRANDFEARAREFCDRLALGLQAAAMIRTAPGHVADAFARARLEARGAHHYGVLPSGVDEAAIVRRAAAR